LQQLALELFNVDETALNKAVAAGSLVEIHEEDDEKNRE